MQPYPGVAPFTPLSTPPGKGVFPTPDVVTTDPRSAANLMAGVESDTDRTNWLAHRTIDFQHDGTAPYMPRGLIDFLANAAHGWSFRCALAIRSAAQAFIDEGGILRVGRPGTGGSVGKIVVNGTGGAAGSEVEATSGGKVRATAGGTVGADGTGATLSAVNGASLRTDANSTFTQEGPQVRAGGNGFTVNRIGSVAASGTVANATAYDVIIVSGNPGVIVDAGGGTGTAQMVTLTPPANGTAPGIVCRLVMGKGRSTSGLPGDVAFLGVESGSGGSSFFGYSQIGSGGGTTAPLFLDMMVEVDSGATRKWVAIASSGAGMPLP